MRPSVAILGAGALGEILAGGLLRAGWEPAEITLAARRPERAEEVEEKLGARCLLDPVEAAAGRQVILITVKPRDVHALLEQLGRTVSGDQLVITLAAGVTCSIIEEALGKVPVIRGMPNTPALVSEAVTAYCLGSHAVDKDRELAEVVLGAVGETVVLDEPQMDSVTAVSGNGPAYVYLLAEALTEAAIREGLPRHAAEKLVDQTLKGAGALLAETHLTPTELRAQVTSPGGTTAAAVHVLEEGGFRAAIEDAVRAASQRAKELGAMAEEQAHPDD